MATYYVRPDGNNSNAGTGPATTQAWQTIGNIFKSGSVVVGGDIVYIAPGTYTETITVLATSPTSEVQIVGNPTSSQFPGVNAGVVKLSAYNAAGTAVVNSGTFLLSATSKNYYAFSNLVFEGAPASGGFAVGFATSRYIKFSKCVFRAETVGGANFSGSQLFLSAPTSTALDATIEQCYFGSSQNPAVYLEGQAQLSDTTVIRSCFFDGAGQGAVGLIGALNAWTITASIVNCTFQNSNQGIYQLSGSSTAFLTIRNCLFKRCTTAITGSSSTSGVQTYNRFISCNSNVTNIPTSATSSSAGVYGVDNIESLLHGLNNLQPYTSYISSPNTSFGIATGAPATDLYGVTWTGTSPDAGAGTYRVITSNPTNIQYNGGVERNASTITIAPGSTSQSIELYLGVTGLTASTAGLSAYYNRTRSADVQINLQARNITQNWTSGGFAEVNANTMPGVYRLDIPNEALAAGADDVTVVVRGASGTNGAVMSIKLSSGGLTTAQTASAVWGALTNDHTTHGTFGWNVLRADQDSKEGLVTLHQSGGISRVDADVHAIANDTAAATALKGALNHDGTGYVDSDVVRISTSTAAADELEGALLHNGTDYIDSNLLSGNSTRVFVGRFQLTQTGTTQGDIIEAFTTDTPSFELQLFDGDNNIVPVTGATLGLRILDVTSTVVETGTPTIEYGTGGIVRWTAPGSYVSIGCPAGMYRLFVDRTVSGTTTTFGPLQIKVQVQ